MARPDGLVFVGISLVIHGPSEIEPSDFWILDSGSWLGAGSEHG
jgi:hypothetical protein